ncbi:hypothetical protein AAFF_G00237960 [Aldrovandia affinis]|uniref:Ephrin RBD domain-containing protein n=1 Tax=Aldrovandia affinis TaxID=143900 RepID=A0AAD7RGZ1_9TELE|nr:hypothetical protein AAFF_G00237960 [Aldrovandia affinis]
MGWYGCPEARTIWKITILFLQVVSTALGKRHVVYWNSTNTRLSQGDLSIEVNPGDYLDIYCPHYPPGTSVKGPPEMLALYLKIQRFTPFSMGFEFLPGHHYYYSSLAMDDDLQLPCMKLRVTVCCETLGSRRGTPAPHIEVRGSAVKAQVSLLLLIPLFIHFFI